MDTDDDNNGATTFELNQLCFAGSDQLCSLVSHKMAPVWDVSRGVVAYTIHASDNSNSNNENDDCRIVNLYASTKYVFALMVNNQDKKLCVWQHEAATGKLIKKLKCGKREESSTACAMTVSSDDATVAVRNGSVLRLYQLENGAKLGKCKVKDSSTTDGNNNNNDDAKRRVPMVVFSKCNALVATSTNSGVTIFSVQTQKAVGTIYLSEEETNNHVEGIVIQRAINSDDDNNDNDDNGSYSILVQSSATGGGMYTLDVSSSSASKKTVLHQTSKLACAEKVVFALLSSSAPVTLVALYDRQRHLTHLQPVDGLSKETTTTLAFPEEPKLDNDNDSDGMNDATATKNAKRKSSLNSNTAVLGPGQAGGESLQITDRLVVAKKQKQSNDDSDGVDSDDDDDDDKEQSIAERLQRLMQEMQESDDDDDDDNQDSSTKIDFAPKKATTESLHHLLTQALQSGDDTMLELALSVRDRRVLQQTLSSLEVSHMSVLLTKLTTRLASKPTRADDLSVWLRFVLQSDKLQQFLATAQNSNNSSNHSSHLLRPLRNLLQERVESFPHLLRLEGRLSLLGQD